MCLLWGSYVGDNYEKDVVGAKAAGMKALFLVRPEHGEHPLQRRKRQRERCDSSALEEGGGGYAEDEGGDGEGEEGIKDLLARFPAADMASFDLRPTSIMTALLAWEERETPQ